MNYEKTSSGLPYKIFPGKKGGAKPKAGDFIKFNVEYRLADRDSVLQSTFTSFPGYSPLDTGKRTVYSFWEVLPMMSAGDSAVISMSVDTLKARGIIPDYTPILVKGQILTVRLKLEEIFKDEKAMVANYDSTIASIKNKEIKDLEAYMAKNNLKGIKTKNGAYVVIDNAGDTSYKADSGKVANIMYRGYVAETGKVFDTNMDTSKHHTDPLPIAVGTRGSIQGMSEGLPYFGKGGKGKILIPSMLAWGAQGGGPDIPAFANVVFDVEVLDVQEAPKRSMSPEMQPQGND
jgi:FKBP-type peptidyl-prolyl cis-trans isomerase FkpA